jgi:hypothetical protein
MMTSQKWSRSSLPKAKHLMSNNGAEKRESAMMLCGLYAKGSAKNGEQSDENALGTVYVL